MSKLGREGTCKKGCCWTPSDVCAKRGGCTCHVRAKDLYDTLAQEDRKQAAMRQADKVSGRRTGNEW